MGALTDLWNSERGLLTILLVIAATVLCAIGRLEVADWTTYTKWALLIYTTGKTATGIASSITGKDTDGVPAKPVVISSAPSSQGVTSSGVVGMPTVAIPPVPTKGA